MKLQQVLLSLCILQLLNSCVVTETTNHFKYHSDNYNNSRFNKPQMFIKPLVADLEVANTKIEKTYSYKSLTLDQAKNAATADFCRETKCDVAIQPTYNIDIDGIKSTKGNISTVTVSYSAYPAVFKNIHSLELKDSILYKKIELGFGVPNGDKKSYSDEINIISQKKNITKGKSPVE